MKNKFLIILFIGTFLSGCVGVSSKGIFGTGVSIAFDPRSVGTQVDDSIMQKNLSARSLLMDKKYLLSVKILVVIYTVKENIFLLTEQLMHHQQLCLQLTTDT